MKTFSQGPSIRGRDRRVVGFTSTYMQSVPITTDVSSNLDQGEVYNIM